jgi:hypothetical protein
MNDFLCEKKNINKYKKYSENRTKRKYASAKKIQEAIEMQIKLTQ